jgi:hypothetical protein
MVFSWAVRWLLVAMVSIQLIILSICLCREYQRLYPPLKAESNTRPGAVRFSDADEKRNPESKDKPLDPWSID